MALFCVRCGHEHDERCWVPFRSDEFWRGAAVALGLILMAMAIRDRLKPTDDDPKETQA